MKLEIKVFLFFCIAFQSCTMSASTTGIWKNERIDKEKRHDIGVLNEKLFNSVKGKDLKTLESIMSHALIENGGKGLDSFMNNIGNSFTSGDRVTMDEFDVHNSTSDLHTTVTNSEGNRAYTLDYFALNKETYVSLFTVHNETNDLLVTAIYGDYDGKWELNILRVGQFKLYGKDAQDYFDMAKLDYKKQHIIDAVDNISLVKECLNPANNIFRYKNEKEMEDFHDSILKEAKTKYPLPLTLKNIPGEPKIFSVYPQMMQEGCYPMIRYLSGIDLNDTVALKMENEKVKKEVKLLFTGIAENKKYLFYQAFNELPGTNHLVRHYGFGETLSN